MGKRDFTIIPIMVGSVSKDDEDKYGKLLSPYFLKEISVVGLFDDWKDIYSKKEPRL